MGGASLYGNWQFGGKSLKVILNNDGKTPTSLIIAPDGTVDFAKAQTFDFKPQTFKDQSGVNHVTYFATVTEPGDESLNNRAVSIDFYRFDPGEKGREALADSVFFYGDYGLEGTVKVKGKSFRALLVDMNSDGKVTIASSGVRTNPQPTFLLVDADGDGKYSQRFNTAQPFNLNGASLEVSTASDGFVLKKSSKKVAMAPVVKTLHAGDRVLSFVAKDMSGKVVHFPEDFRGKVVMLDFWATWCGPCMGEVPNVVKVYNQEHARGFEILGISLDDGKTIKDIGPVTKEKDMTWDQIADGKFWKADIAVKYSINAIPQAYIVDGDTGRILAEGEAIRGDALLPAVTKALASKNK